MILQPVLISAGLWTLPVDVLANIAGNAPPPPGGTQSFDTSYITMPEAITGVAVLVFGLVMALLGVHLLARARLATDDVIRFLALITVVSGTLFLVACGYNAQDIAPAIGLLGTIAGYLLGRGTKKQPSTDPSTPRKREPDNG